MNTIQGETFYKIADKDLAGYLADGQQLSSKSEIEHNPDASVLFPQITDADVEGYFSDNGKLVKVVDGEIVESYPPESDIELRDEIPKLEFKLALLDHGVLEQDVIDTINLAFQNNLISEIKKEELLLRWTQSAVIESHNPDLFALIPLLNQVKGSEVITQQDIENIFRK
jgi:hypothetical protein